MGFLPDDQHGARRCLVRFIIHTCVCYFQTYQGMVFSEGPYARQAEGCMGHVLLSGTGDAFYFSVLEEAGVPVKVKVGQAGRVRQAEEAANIAYVGNARQEKAQRVAVMLDMPEVGGEVLRAVVVECRLGRQKQMVFVVELSLFCSQTHKNKQISPSYWAADG